MFKFIKQLFKLIKTIIKIISFFSAIYLLLDDHKQKRVKDKLSTLAEDIQETADSVGEAARQ